MTSYKIKAILPLIFLTTTFSAFANNFEANTAVSGSGQFSKINELPWSAMKEVNVLDSTPKSISSVNVVTGFVSISDEAKAKHGISEKEIPIVSLSSPSLKNVKSDNAKLVYQFKSKATQDFTCLGRIFTKKTGKSFATMRCLRIGNKF